MLVANPIRILYDDISLMQKRAKELIVEGFTVLITIDRKGDWSGYLAHRYDPVINIEESFNLEFGVNTNKLNFDPYFIYH